MSPIQPSHPLPQSVSRAPRVVLIALDGTDPETISRHIDAGWLPNLAKAFQGARAVEFQTLGDLFLTSPWPCVASGVAVENHGIHAFRPFKCGTFDVVEGVEQELPTPFWETAVRSGLRAAVFDVSMYGPPSEEAALEGLRFIEWGVHPPLRPAGSFPRSLISSMTQRFGHHPCTNDDSSLSTAQSLRGVQIKLCQGVRQREQILKDLLDHDPPDLLVAGFSEAHIAEHQFQNLNAPGHPRHDPDVLAALGESPLRLVYEEIDAVVGRILQRLPAGVTVLMTCLSGIRVTYGGSHLLEDVLRRIGFTASATAPQYIARRLWHRVPTWIRHAAARFMPRLVQRNADKRFLASINWAETRAFAMPWTYDGYLRINQVGREPQGIVAPGAERSALLDEIEQILRELRISGTNKPAVRNVVRTQEAYPGRASAKLPDLMVLWNNDQPLESVESARVGRIPNRDCGPRGAHTTRGAIFAWGPLIATGEPISGVRDIDIAPTVLALLGISPPDDLDGRVIFDLLRSDGKFAVGGTVQLIQSDAA